MTEALFLEADAPLRAADAVVALIVLDDGRYLMQHRDALPGIFYPDHWGFFGGAKNTGETDLAVLVRELKEELGLVFAPEDARYFTSVEFDFGFAGLGRLKRVFYEIALPVARLAELSLGEGRAMRAFEGGQLLLEERVVPYDAFALWLHLRRARLER